MCNPPTCEGGVGNVASITSIPFLLGSEFGGCSIRVNDTCVIASLIDATREAPQPINSDKHP